MSKVPINLAVLLSIALHAVPLAVLGIDDGGAGSGRFLNRPASPYIDVTIDRQDIVDLNPSRPVEPRERLAASTPNVPMPVRQQRASEKGAVLELAPDFPNEIYLPPSEVQRQAELLLPFDVDLIPGAGGISGRMRIELKIDRRGKVREIRVIDAVDPGKSMEKVVIPWLKASVFQPGRKDGVAVGSVLVIDLTLVPPERLDPGYRASRSPGQPLWMDDKGKFINDAPPVRRP